MQCTTCYLICARCSTDAHHVVRNYWEKKPLLIKRHKKNYYKNLFSSDAMDQILKEVPLLSLELYCARHGRMHAEFSEVHGEC